MDKSEQYADIIAKACQALIERKLAPILTRIDEMAKSLDGFMRKGDAAQFVTAEGFRVELDVIRNDLAGVAKCVEAKPDLETLRAEQANVATKAAADLFATLPKPENGKSVTVDEVRPLLEQMVKAIPAPRDGGDGKDGADGLPGKDGRDGKDGALGERGADGAAGAAGLPGEKGADGINGRDGADGLSGKDGAPGERGEKGADGINGKDGRDGIDGRNVEPEVVRQLVDEVATKAIAEIPRPKDGEPGERGATGEQGEAGRDGRDGQPGVPGAPGEKGLDGINGRDGVDGIGIEDVALELKEDGRTMIVRFSGAGREKSFEVVCPWQIYRGVYVSGKRYARGDVVTYGGSQFTAKQDTTEPPETKGTGGGWQLSVKRGADAKPVEP